MASSTNGAQIPIADIAITDTNAHTYRTDPYSKGSGIAIIQAMLNRRPKPYTLAVYVQNTEDQELTAAVIGNIDTTKTYGDFTLGTGTIAAGSQDLLTVYMQGQNAFPADYISLSLSFATTPTSGSVIAFVRFNEG